MSAIVPQNYEAVPLGEKFAWVHGQPGMRAVEAAADSVRTMGERLGTITTDAGRSMRGLGVTWAGPASEAAQRSSEQLVDRAVDTQSLADNGAARILDYGRSFDEMRTRVAFEDPSQLSWVETVMEPSKYAWDLRPWAEGEDHVSVLRRNQDHDAAANDALRWHEANARAADDGFVTDGRPPPAVPVGATAVGSGSGGNGAGVGGASSAPPPVVRGRGGPGRGRAAVSGADLRAWGGRTAGCPRRGGGTRARPAGRRSRAERVRRGRWCCPARRRCRAGRVGDGRHRDRRHRDGRRWPAGRHRRWTGRDDGTGSGCGGRDRSGRSGRGGRRGRTRRPGRGAGPACGAVQAGSRGR